eukprot:1154577-Pelagomonas_calceolata.AAC.9
MQLDLACGVFCPFLYIRVDCSEAPCSESPLLPSPGTFPFMHEAYFGLQSLFLHPAYFTYLNFYQVWFLFLMLVQLHKSRRRACWQIGHDASASVASKVRHHDSLIPHNQPGRYTAHDLAGSKWLHHGGNTLGVV